MIAYCLMPNHYHFLMKQGCEIPISEVIQDVFNAYVKAFNKRFGRTGTLFEERFKAKHVDNDNYLIHLCRYIHRNPLEAGLVTDIGLWKYSDYQEWISGKKSSQLVSSLFSRPEDYARFVLEYESSSDVSPTFKNYLFD
jgi:putative transposase